MAIRGNMEVKKIIEAGDIFLGIEFGSTRMKTEKFWEQEYMIGKTAL